MKGEWQWMADKSPVKCVKPLKHSPQFESKYHCKQCAREAGGEQ